MHPPIPLPNMLVLIRHAEGEDDLMSRKDKTRRLFSTHLCRLSKKGVVQAKELGNWLRKRYTFDLHYSSYYLRALETFKIVYPNIEPIIDARLIEIRRGIEDLLTDKEINRLLPWNETKRREKEGRYHFRPLNGESWSDGEIRLRSFWTTLQLESAGKKVCIFGHGKTGLILRKMIHGWTGEETIKMHETNKPENASVTVYRRNKGKLVLELANFTPWKK